MSEKCLNDKKGMMKPQEMVEFKNLLKILPLRVAAMQQSKSKVAFF